MLNIKKQFQISSNRRITGSSFRTASAIEWERKRQESNFSGIIHPFSNFRWFWDILMTLLLLLALVGQPLQIAFYSSMNDEQEDIRIAIASLILDLLFFVDIGINFRTGIPDSYSDHIILEPRKIARRYAKSWFVIDALSSLPFDTVNSILLHTTSLEQEERIYFRIIRLLGLLKVLRLFRVIQCLTRIQKAFHLPELRIRLINLLVMIFTILHWLSCWHWVVAELCNPPWRRKEFSWISRTKLWDKPVWFKYINAALRALSNMGCLGYGGFAGEAPAEPEDIIATLISIMIGATCFALYIGTMGSIVQSVNTSEQKYRDVEQEVKEYMKFRNIPGKLQRRVMAYLEKRYRRRYFDEGSILLSISEVLRHQIELSNCSDLVNNAQILKFLPPHFLKRLVRKLELQVFLEEDTIITSGSDGEAMYFIQDGEVSVISEKGEVIAILRSGDYFGEVALLDENHVTTATVVANDYSSIYRLGREDFYQLFAGLPETLQKIREVAKYRLEETRRKTIRVEDEDNYVGFRF